MRVMLIEGLSHDRMQAASADDVDAIIDRALDMEGDERGEFDMILIVDDGGDVTVGDGVSGQKNTVIGKSVII